MGKLAGFKMSQKRAISIARDRKLMLQQTLGRKERGKVANK